MSDDQKPPVKTLDTQLVVVDTNILQFLSNNESSGPIVKYIVELYGRSFQFCISQISIYERLRGAPRNKQKEIVDVLDLFSQKEITQDIINIATLLHNIYHLQDPNTKKMDIDKFIAATAILSNGYILTENERDFPCHFFDEVECKQIPWSENGRSRMRMIYLLQPNYKNIQESINRKQEQKDKKDEKTKS